MYMELLHWRDSMEVLAEQQRPAMYVSLFNVIDRDGIVVIAAVLRAQPLFCCARRAGTTDGRLPHIGGAAERSEEHTSELQSPDHLVCRLLLEKKKTEATA